MISELHRNYRTIGVTFPTCPNFANELFYIILISPDAMGKAWLIFPKMVIPLFFFIAALLYSHMLVWRCWDDHPIPHVVQCRAFTMVCLGFWSPKKIGLHFTIRFLIYCLWKFGLRHSQHVLGCPFLNMKNVISAWTKHAQVQSKLFSFCKYELPKTQTGPNT